MAEKENLSIGFKIGETFKLVGKHFAMSIPKHGVDITLEQFILLNVINQKSEDTTQQELSVFLHKDKSGILRLTDELERKNMIVRIVDSADRRKKTLMLTKKGLEVLTKVLEIEASVIEKLLDGVSAKEMEMFSNVLDRILINGGKS